MPDAQGWMNTAGKVVFTTIRVFPPSTFGYARSQSQSSFAQLHLLLVMTHAPEIFQLRKYECTQQPLTGVLLKQS